MFAWVQSPAGAEILHWAGLPVKDVDTMLYVGNGIPATKSTAFLKVSSLLRFPWRLFLIGWVVPRFVRDWLYDLVARTRYRFFGREAECRIAPPEFLNRFL